MTRFLQRPSTSREDSVKEAEIKLCGFIAEHNLSFLTMDHLCPLLTKNFPDSQIAQDLAVRRTKCKAIITNVIGASHKSSLANLLKQIKFSVLVDESTDIGVNKSACIVIRYFNAISGKIESHLWELIAMSDVIADVDVQGTAEHMFKKIVNSFETWKISMNNIIGFGSDGCNVMMGDHNSVASRFRSACPGIYILKCICHSLHLCASEACKSLPRSIEDLARNIYNFFKVLTFKLIIMLYTSYFFIGQQ